MAEIKVIYDEHMGSDLKVCRMAKESFKRTTAWQDGVIGHLSEKDQRLIKMLSRGMGSEEYATLILRAAQTDDTDAIERLMWKLRNTTPHLAPFGHCFVTFKFYAPVFVMRQIVKHEYIRISELSMRYVRGMPEYYRPKSWRAVAADVKQGSGGDHGDQEEWFGNLESAWQDDCEFYKGCIYDGLAPEQARIFLRLCHMTEGFFSGSLDAIAGIVQKRLDPHAQEETREFARQIDKIMTPLYPHAWSALMEGIER